MAGDEEREKISFQMIDISASIDFDSNLFQCESLLILGSNSMSSWTIDYFIWNKTKIGMEIKNEIWVETNFFLCLE